MARWRLFLVIIMHYTVKIESTEHAVAEFRQYLGTEKANNFLRAFATLHKDSSVKTRLRILYTYMSLAGIQGRAVIHGLYRHMFVQNCN